MVNRNFHAQNRYIIVFFLWAFPRGLFLYLAIYCIAMLIISSSFPLYLCVSPELCVSPYIYAALWLWVWVLFELLCLLHPVKPAIPEGSNTSHKHPTIMTRLTNNNQLLYINVLTLTRVISLYCKLLFFNSYLSHRSK